jgi:hypothetical protein
VFDSVAMKYNMQSAQCESTQTEHVDVYIFEHTEDADDAATNIRREAHDRSWQNVTVTAIKL